MGKYHITHDYDSLLDELFGTYDDFIKKVKSNNVKNGDNSNREKYC